MALRHDSFDQDMDRLIDALLRRRRAGLLRRLRTDQPALALLLYATAGFLAAAMLLLTLAVVHGAVFGRSLEETLGGAGPVWALIIAGLALGAAAGFLRGRQPV